MADNTTNNDKNTEVVDAESLGKASNPVSKGTLIMIVGTIILVIVAAIVISRFFSQPTGGVSGSDSSYAMKTAVPQSDGK